MAEPKDNAIWHRGYLSGQKRVAAYIERAAKAERALQLIADMDAAGERADDLGRAARIAREALRPDGVTVDRHQTFSQDMPTRTVLRNNLDNNDVPD